MKRDIVDFITKCTNYQQLSMTIRNLMALFIGCPFLWGSGKK